MTLDAPFDKQACRARLLGRWNTSSSNGRLQPEPLSRVDHMVNIVWSCTAGHQQETGA
jgi:hypothetical protein